MVNFNRTVHVAGRLWLVVNDQVGVVTLVGAEDDEVSFPVEVTAALVGALVPLAVRRRPALVAQVAGNVDEGDLFSLDGGQTWYVCAVNNSSVGTIAVYCDGTRQNDSDTVRVPATADQACFVMKGVL